MLFPSWRQRSSSVTEPDWKTRHSALLPCWWDQSTEMRSTQSTGRRSRRWFGESTPPVFFVSLSCSSLTSIPLQTICTSFWRSPNWSSLWPPALLFDSSCTDVQTHRSWRRKLLRVPSVAFSCHRMNCCAFPARTTCPTASPRYKQTINDLIGHKIFLSEQENCFLTFIFNQTISLSGSSHAERRLVCVSSLWISGSVLTVQSVSEFLTPPWKIASECPLLKGQLHCFYSSNCICKSWKAIISMW